MKEVDAVGVVQLEDVKARVARRLLQTGSILRSRGIAAVQDTGPTKELDAVMLGNALVGYGGNMSLNNIAIIENIMNMSIMEANHLVPDAANTLDWYAEFVDCLRSLGCFIADSGYTQYSEKTIRVEAELVIKDIVKGILDGVVASTPAATILGTVVGTTIDGLKSDGDSLNLFNRQVKTPKGMRMSFIPCEQQANGLLIAAATTLSEDGKENNGGVLFVDWKTSARKLFHGKAFITFNPAKYAEYKDDIENYLGQHRKEVLSKRFSRRKA
ncbi:hypothetical protein [Pseudomonas sp. TWP3-2]|uniref:hypothetical protein n=1 Tax=Pseudomonas sp. TWP3-2 TaxID=2804574 RepID=UPI003CEFBF65